jgi:hypothetical protein
MGAELGGRDEQRLKRGTWIKGLEGVVKGEVVCQEVPF